MSLEFTPYITQPLAWELLQITRDNLREVVEMLRREDGAVLHIHERWEAGDQVKYEVILNGSQLVPGLNLFRSADGAIEVVASDYASGVRGQAYHGGPLVAFQRNNDGRWDLVTGENDHG